MHNQEIFFEIQRVFIFEESCPDCISLICSNATDLDAKEDISGQYINAFPLIVSIICALL